ncbi:MAG: rhomboid family intramembrane serine protease [Planctomycetota bacterium]
MLAAPTPRGSLLRQPKPGSSMFIPVSTDAPVYYWPFATVGLIVVNVLVFIGMVAGVIDPTAGWVLTHGQGLRPIEWVLSNFTHGGLFHLLGNMVFLWVFGLVVEGKLGWLRFLACYLAIGVLQCAVEQVCTLGYSGSESVSYGASSIIYGLLAIAAVWAPKNEVKVFYWFFFFVGAVDVSIGWLAGFYIGLDLLWVIILQGGSGSSLLHVMGALIGFPLGILLLKRGVVDCEGWDMFHVWRGDAGGKDQTEEEDLEFSKQLNEKRKQQRGEQVELAKSQVQMYLAEGNAGAAKKLLDKLAGIGADVSLPPSDLAKLVAGLHKQQRWAESAPLMDQYIRTAPDRADPMRVKLAQICVVELNRPGRAIDLLSRVDLAKLPAAGQQLAKKVARHAQKMQAEGVVELDDDRW